MKKYMVLATWAASLWLLAAANGRAQGPEAVCVDSACQVMHELMTISGNEIPRSMLANAQGIVIIPDLLKGGFLVGVRYGRGIVAVRDEHGQWQPPEFVTLTGGSFGWQAGVQATDIILVFKTRNSVRGLLSGKFTLGADAAVAAGPVGREAAAATDTTLRAEIYTYSRSRGLFAGIALDGSALQMDPKGTAAYYATVGAAPPSAGQLAAVPPSAARLLDCLRKYTGAPAAPAATSLMAPTPAMPAVADPDARRQLAETSLRLYAVLDPSWKAYLSLPPEVYSAERFPAAEATSRALGRFETVAQDSRYRLLAQTVEFRATYDALRRLTNSATRVSPTLALPPPPQ